MIPKLDASKVNLVVIYWSDNSRNTFFVNDPEMMDFIEWKFDKEPELTYTHEIMSVTEYKTKHCLPEI